LEVFFATSSDSGFCFHLLMVLPGQQENRCRKPGVRCQIKDDAGTRKHHYMTPGGSAVILLLMSASRSGIVKARSAAQVGTPALDRHWDQCS
jgi:hypothetical protein